MAGTSAPRVPHCRDLRPIGERQASRLYTGHSDRLGCPVAVTVYPALADETAQRRFDGAAANARRLAAHPSVLTVHDWGHGDDGSPWVVTDPQPPETIDTLLRTEGPLPVEQALRIGVLVAGALETAHRAGVVHGDLSPARLVLGPQGEPLVVDIGLAEFSDFPGFGALHNPIRYFAPPEVLERTGLSPASDAYSLATTVYALLTGGAPHEKPADITDSNASLLLRILQIRVPPIVRPGEDIDGVEAALLPALAHAAEGRPPVLDLAWSFQAVQRNLGLALVEPVVLDLGAPDRSFAPVATVAAEPEGAPAPAPPQDADGLPSWYGGSPPTGPAGALGSGPAPVYGPAPGARDGALGSGRAPGSGGAPGPTPGSGRPPGSGRDGAPGPGLVHLFSETPPDFTDRTRDAIAPHWATGLGRPAGPAPTAGAADRAGGTQPRPPDQPRRRTEPDPPRPPPRPSQPRRPMEPRRPTEPYRPYDPDPPDEPDPPAAAKADARTPTNGHRPGGHAQGPPIGGRPAGVNGRGHGLRQAPTARDDGGPAPVRRPPIDIAPGSAPGARPAQPHRGSPGDETARPVASSRPPVDATRGPSAVPAIVPRGRRAGEPPTRPGRPPDAGRRGPPARSDAAQSGVPAAGGRTRPGSSLERARQARMRRDAASGIARPNSEDRTSAPRVKDLAPASGAAPAAPVIVLIVVVVLLTLGVAYMVITGDGTSRPVDEQPGASTPSVPASMHEA
jgi:serine/threonine protein kinase